MVELNEPLKNFSVVFLSAGRGFRLGKLGKKKTKMLNRYKWKNYYFKTNRNFNFKRIKRTKYYFRLQT